MAIRVDLQAIAEMIEPGSRVLDVGCGDGELLDFLAREKQVDGRGIELEQPAVRACLDRGLSVIQGNADTDLEEYPDAAFDYVVLSATLQAMLRPRETLVQMLRIGRRSIVSFPNFGYWKVRLDLLLNGRMPVTPALPHQWYDTPNIHLCTTRDFVALCDELGFVIERGLSIDAAGHARAVSGPGLPANLFGRLAVFLLHQPD
jgi:methionine biosynthesis protein MetW